MKMIKTPRYLLFVFLIIYAPISSAGELRDYSLPSERYIQSYDRGSLNLGKNGARESYQKTLEPSPEMNNLKEKLTANVGSYNKDQLKELISQYTTRFDKAVSTGDRRQAAFFKEMRKIAIRELNSRG